MDQFYHISQQYEVKLSIEHSKMKISLEGVLEEMDKAKDKIFELLRALQEELFLDEMIKKSAETVQWNILVSKFNWLFFFLHTVSLMSVSFGANFV